MRKITITKEEIILLDKVYFYGDMHIIDNTADAKAAINYLRKESIVGFDTETRPSFRKGQLRQMALMQVSTEDECFLFRLNKIGIPDFLKDFIEDKSILKIGLSLKDDFRVLSRSYDSHTTPEGFIDLQHMVKEYGINDIGLQRIYAILFDKRISKGQKLSNWEAEELTYEQQEYASIDAWACLKIYQHLKEGKFDPDNCKYSKEIDDNETF